MTRELPVGFRYWPSFFDQIESERTLARLWNGIDWRQEEIVVFGRRRLQPRLSAWFGDPGAAYRYSGLALEPTPWTPDLTRLRDRVQSKLGTTFNSVLVNAYRDGRDSMGWHSDDEAELGSEPVIASLSFGQARRFRIMRRDRKAAWALELESGSLLVMEGDAQAAYRHALPRTARDVGLRINLTFRNVIQA